MNASYPKLFLHNSFLVILSFMVAQKSYVLPVYLVNQKEFS